MSNNKQSSVEQFAIALYDNGLLQGNGNQIDDLLLHFKAMHKEEIMDAHTTGYIIGGGNGDIHEPKQYYKKTFGGKNEQQ
jgi:hypothetical protein